MSNINVDVIVQNVSKAGTTDLSFTVGRTDREQTYNLVSEVAKRIGASNVEVDTEIAGFTIGRLFQGGDRAEFWGKLSYNRHLENPGQDNFASYSAYMMAIGKGYSPWSKQLAFRYGFGFGINYAQEVPLAEQIKQARKGEKTSRLLNYLEFMIDFPVDRFIKSKLTRNCFLGLTVMHRSGIFGTSDVLGSVAGGSDWVTLSYECVR